MLAAAALFVFALASVETQTERGVRPAREPLPAAQGTQAAPGAQAIIDRYCVTCHNARMRTGGLALEGLDVAQAGRQAPTWEKVVRKVRTGMMPPANAPRPDRATLDGFAAAVEATVDRAAATAPNPGAPVLHRLNRTEYANAVRDLIDLPIDAAALLPGDDSSEGFDNMASVLGVSPALMQGYVSAAAKISRLAVGDPTLSADVTTYLPPRGLSQAGHREGMPLGTRGGLLVQHVFPLDAEYEFRVGRAGVGLFGLPPVGVDDEFEITLNGERVQLLGRNAPRGGIRLRIPAGPQTIGVAVVRRANARGVDDLFSELANTAGVQSLAINGPLNPTGPGDTPSRRRIFSCRPATPSEEVPCARQILSALATRALRKPVNGNDPMIETFLGFFESGRALRGFEAGIQYALARVLVDPQFIDRFERAPAGLRAGSVYRISDLELASRLSFFLWSSIPDDQLIDRAREGRLHTPAVLEQQVRRMMADPRAEALTTNFAGQWLYLRNLKNMQPNSEQFPDFDDNLRQAFEREASLFFDSIVREDRNVLDLMTADYTFVNARLAKHYGIPNVYGSQFRRVTLPDDTRRGLLGKGAVLMVTSHTDRTSPVVRGKWILDNLLGAPPPAPPANVPPLNESPERAGRVLSMRERMEEHRANPVCANCHKLMDPIGLSLENFDAVGAWRARDGDSVTEQGTPIDASGQLLDGTKVNGVVTLRQALLKQPEIFVSTVTEKLLTYALGRGLQPYDMPSVRAIVGDGARTGYRFSSLVLGIVNSTPFQKRVTVTEPAGTVAAN